MWNNPCEKCIMRYCRPRLTLCFELLPKSPTIAAKSCSPKVLWRSLSLSFLRTLFGDGPIRSSKICKESLPFRTGLDPP